MYKRQFLNPAGMRRALRTLVDQEDGVLRVAGLLSMLAALGLLYLVN